MVRGVKMEDWIYVTRSSMPPLKSNVRYLYDLWKNRHLPNQGEQYEELQRALAMELGVTHITLTANGHLAIELALNALGCTGEVITTPFTAATTTQAIINSGCTPVFCDIDLAAWTLDVSKIESLITPKTSAILAVHVFGRICNVEQIDAIAKKHNLRVIYDAAHAYKVKVNDEPISKFGHCTIFSLHASKLFHAVEGGVLATNDVALAKQFTLLQNIGHTDKSGFNAKMSEFHAAMGLCAIDYVDGWIAKRKELFEYYVDQLKVVEGLSIPSLQPNVTTNYSYFPILLDGNREGLIAYLKEHQIGTLKYSLTSSIVSTGDVGPDNRLMEKSSTSVAKWVADRVLCMPLYTDLTFEQIDKICACIKVFVRMTSLPNGLGQAHLDVVTKEITTG